MAKDAARRSDPYRPCENPACMAVDSTHCEFNTEPTGQVPPKDRARARAVGCRVVRFAKDDA